MSCINTKRVLLYYTLLLLACFKYKHFSFIRQLCPDVPHKWFSSDNHCCGLTLSRMNLFRYGMYPWVETGPSSSSLKCSSRATGSCGIFITVHRLWDSTWNDGKKLRFGLRVYRSCSFIWSIVYKIKPEMSITVSLSTM